MKKLLCYLGILFLLSLILFPPALRIFLPDKIEKENEKVIENKSLYCSSDNFITNTTYEGDKINMIIMKKFNIYSDTDGEDKRLVNDALIDSFDTIKDDSTITYDSKDDYELISIDFSLSEHKNLDLTSFTKTIDLQKEYYEEQNLSCNIRN